MSPFFLEVSRHVLVLLEPIGLLWLALILLTLLLWRKGQRGFGAATCALAIAIYVIGATDVPGALVRSLERRYAGVNLAELPACDAVVLLGGGLQPSRYEVGGLHLTDAGDRVIMALEMIRLGKAPVLLAGGGGALVDGRILAESELLGQALARFRVPVPEFIALGHCADTHDEALRTVALARTRGWRRFLLVTSASHLPRAVATFRTAGLDVTPVPCNFLTTLSTAPSPRRLAMPGYGGFQKMSVWMHEKIGWWEYRRRGWINPMK